MRADAAANREAILTAARHILATSGGPLKLTSVAHAAGVGAGTMYRNFATQDELLLALMQSLRESIVRVCDSHRQGMATSPNTTWPVFVYQLVALRLGSFAPQLLASHEEFATRPEVEDIRQDVIARLHSILDQAKDAGLVASDLDAMHFHLGIGAITRPLPPVAQERAPGFEQWMIQTYLNGLLPRP